MFNVHDTIKLYNIDASPPKYMVDTLALDPVNTVLDKLNANELLAETDILHLIDITN